MIKYQRITGVNLEDSSGLPTIQRTPEGEAMGAVPGWSVLLDPDYPVGNGLRNRAQKSKVATLGAGSSLNLSEFYGGQSAVFADGGSQIIGPDINRGGIDPDRFTIFAVVGDMSSGPNNRHYITLPLEDHVGELTPTVAIVRLSDPVRYRIAFYEDGVNAIGTPTRALTQTYSLDENPANLVMWTFSVEEGVGIWLNGEKIESNREDVRPLTAGYLSDEFRMFYGFRGKYGMSGILNIDLGAPENTGHRHAIEKFLMDKYGIPEGPPQ